MMMNPQISDYIQNLVQMQQLSNTLRWKHSTMQHDLNIKSTIHDMPKINKDTWDN